MRLVGPTSQTPPCHDTAMCRRVYFGNFFVRPSKRLQKLEPRLNADVHEFQLDDTNVELRLRSACQEPTPPCHDKWLLATSHQNTDATVNEACRAN